jgi:phage terminase small subunit
MLLNNGTLNSDQQGEKMNLSLKQKRFCDEYLIDLNATQAAIRAGYSKKTAASQGERLLRKVEIQACVQKR